jgi:hypothetical protein
MIESFVLKLVTGIALMWLLMPRKDVTDGFFRIQMLVALGLSVLLVLTIQPTSPPSQSVVTLQRTHISDAPISNVRTQPVTDFFRITQIIAAVIAYAGHIVWKLGRRIPGGIAIYSVAGLCLIGMVTNSFDAGIDVNTFQLFFSQLTSAAVLGATLTGMLLGHWYLTTPTMSISPLSWFTKALAVAAIGRLLVTCLSLGRFGFASHDVVHLLWLFVRVFGGILTPFVAAFVVSRILRSETLSRRRVCCLPR